MKNRFTTLDLISEILELQSLIGMRNGRESCFTLIESGIRIHQTSFERSKNPAPSGFSMKLRKHINNKRLESIRQMGNDRVVELTFGSGDALYRLILELYDKGNLILTDKDYLIMNILRPRLLERGNPNSNKMVVKENYPVKEEKTLFDPSSIKDLLSKAKPSDALKRVVIHSFPYGPALLEHFLLSKNIPPNIKAKDVTDEIITSLEQILSPEHASTFFSQNEPRIPIIVQKKDGDLFTYSEFHPFAMEQHSKLDSELRIEFPTFDHCIDEFFSKIESQKIDLKTFQQEKLALKKLENVKKDHSERIVKLQHEQNIDKRKGELIELNNDLVENALKVMRSSLANQIAWNDIQELIDDASSNGDPVAKRICKLKLETNNFSLRLSDPYSHTYDSDDEETEALCKEYEVDINIELSAQANARKYYAQKKAAAVKEVRTIQSQSVAIKSAERKTKQTLKEVAAISTIIKARKTFWFEKFYWFISSENYLVIAGRDMQQNEFIIKRYMKTNDIYVHADLHGATSVVIKNPSAWDSKMVTNAWWVYSSQVSKTAPTGEYLTTGSFVIRGKKNFLPPCHLVLGFGILFKLEDGSIARHKDERKVRTLIEGEEEITQKIDDDDEEINISDDNMDDESAPLQETELSVIKEEEKNRNNDENYSKKRESDVKLKSPDKTSSNSEDSDHENTDNLETSKMSPTSQTVIDAEEEVESGDDNEISFPDTNVEIGYSKKKGEMKVNIQSQTTAETETFSFKDSSNSLKSVSEGVESSMPQKNTQIRGKKGNPYEAPSRENKGRDLQEAREKKCYSSKRSCEKKATRQRAKERQQRKTTIVKKTESKTSGETLEEGDLLEDFDNKVAVSDEVDMLDSLTGIPVDEDELLFCVPIVAPYQVMTNYKFKVKVTPGTGKKGKATKMALSLFALDKSSSGREKDLFKSMKDQDVARNLPGKVKLSGQQAIKKQRKKK
ncbi:Nuclear export mediator factor NEMF,Nuclear export mediator factor Nemf [Lepeophtheirus salmonis]|uniref:Nuclear export mediator factor NEMF,Nuclear export mediator factor Nemf n=1 Tax=Lepeophtheirus salmonis TaxID=72036 RepID=A0A7R8CXJ5_LEPSM|nr:Nuclear export mediator factor NEMF,Nuclear export mediator factor Nemf [Lepeophtheirus salmonis]CAF2931598.1 Nuclear export mediator factor NEMF,Nuclear export mediator factor Nemf [Lepeophtheirus salmonis]